MRSLGALLLLLFIWSSAPPSQTLRAEELGANPSMFAVERTLVRPDGSRAMVRVDVLAESPDEAAEVVDTMLPGVHQGGSGVRAQWAAWSWRWEQHEIPVEVAYNPTGAPNAFGPQLLLAGLQAWSGVTSSSFRYAYAGVTNNVASILDSGPDGENVISWEPLPCERGCVLALTSKESTHEVDMVLNSNPEAAAQLGVGTSVDWRTVILHELGHMAGLEHSCPVPFGPCTAAEADAVMYFQYRGVLRTLAADDIAGISALYPLAAEPEPPAEPPGMPVVLEPGWNFVILPAGPVAGLQQHLPCLGAIYARSGDRWSVWARVLPPSLVTLDAVETGVAYWVKAEGGCAVVIRGS